MNDIRHLLTIEPSGKFYFPCPLESLCGDDPQISGWMINAQRWHPSPQDEATVLSIFRMFRSVRVLSAAVPLRSRNPNRGADCLT